jgi:hypothetical protein
MIVLSMLIGPAERPPFEVSSVRELWVVLDLGSPLIKIGGSGRVPDRREGLGIRTPSTL